MRKVFYWALLLLPLVGCTGTGTKNEQLTHERDSLNMLLVEKDSMMNQVFTAMNAIAENLDAIKTREKLIAQNAAGNEYRPQVTTQISQDIEAIDQLLLQNRETIARLQRSAAALKQANVKIAGLEKMIDQLNRQVEEKDQEIRMLKGNLQTMEARVSELDTQVSDLNSQVSDLNQQKETLAGEVKSASDALNTVYYIVGSEKELLSKEIVYKRGFIGRTLKINENRSLDSFTQVDLRMLDEVMVGQKKATLVSSHPAGSYDWIMNSDGTFESLKITDKAKFWEYSKVLVISYK